jgi:acyl-CoA thioester hydrolase
MGMSLSTLGGGRAGSATRDPGVGALRRGRYGSMNGMPRHRVLTPLRWSDMDAYGHVNNVQFLRLLEDARVIAFAATGTDDGGSLVDIGLLVARSEIEYLAPLVYRPEPVAIDMWVTRIAGASFELAYEVRDERGRDGAGAAVYARAVTTLVTYDLVRHQPRRLIASERKRLEEWRDGPVPWRHRRSD